MPYFIGYMTPLLLEVCAMNIIQKRPGRVAKIASVILGVLLTSSAIASPIFNPWCAIAHVQFRIPPIRRVL